MSISATEARRGRFTALSLFGHAASGVKLLASAVLTCLGLLVVTFLIGRVVPIDPVLAVVGDRASAQVYQRVYLELGGTTLEVMSYPQPKSPISARAAEQRLGWQCLALEVEDMDRALEALRAKGIQPAWGPVKRPDYARAEIRDPDGNPIELRQWTR